MGIVMGSGQLFMQSDGMYIPLGGIKEANVNIEESNDQNPNRALSFEHIINEPRTFTFECKNVVLNWRVLNMLLGLPTTNNYYKMHGGIMYRKLNRKKRIKN